MAPLVAREPQKRRYIRSDATILIVDDDPAKRLALSSILESLGHTVVEAASGDEALRCVLKQDFAVILMDVRMPDMDGFETANLIGRRKRSESTPIIFVTAYRDDEIETAAGYANGAVDFIFGAFEPDVVRAKVAVFVELFLNSLALQRSLLEITALSQAFRDSEIRTQAILDNVADGIVTSGADGLIETMNGAAETLFGRREDEMIGAPFDSLLSPEVLGELPRFAAPHQDGADAKARAAGPSESVGLHKDGSSFPLEIELTDLELGTRVVRICCMRNIAERKLHLQALEYQALHDGLTGLPNRTLFGDRLVRAIATATRTTTPFALLVLDLDGFKAVNDTLGHERGDDLLRIVAERLTDVLRNSDTVARLGGDEFGVLAVGPVDLDGAEKVAWKIQQVLQPTFDVAGFPVDVRASVGISLFPEHGTDSADLLRRADLAMYEAKRTSSSYAVYAPAGEKRTASELARLGELRHCIEHDELVLHYQPKIDVGTGRISGVEALLRWNHPIDGLLYPDRFLGHIERSELIRPVTRWVIDEALRQQRQWSDAGLDLTMAINLSGRSLNSRSELPDTLAELTEKWGTATQQVVLELTENSLIDASVPDVLERLHHMGYRLSIDDFGTGYSSLAYLQRLPVDELKIDKSFVVNLAANAADAVIVRSTIDLAHNLGLTVVAEGVEDETALSILEQYGADAVQGYFFSRPFAPEALNDWLDASPYGSRPATNPARIAS